MPAKTNELVLVMTHQRGHRWMREGIYSRYAEILAPVSCDELADEVSTICVSRWEHRSTQS